MVEVAPSSGRMSHQGARALPGRRGWWSMTMSIRWPGGSELLPVSGWLSTSAMTSKASGSTCSTGMSATLRVSTMARFWARPTIPP